jgi:hypothetical protein
MLAKRLWMPSANSPPPVAHAGLAGLFVGQAQPLRRQVKHGDVRESVLRQGNRLAPGPAASVEQPSVVGSAVQHPPDMLQPDAAVQAIRDDERIAVLLKAQSRSWLLKTGRPYFQSHSLQGPDVSTDNPSSK